MKKYIEFLEKLNKLTKETGIAIENFGDQFYSPKLVYQSDDNVFLDYDHMNKTYIARVNDPYDGEIIFPKELNNENDRK